MGTEDTEDTGLEGAQCAKDSGRPGWAGGGRGGQEQQGVLSQEAPLRHLSPALPRSTAALTPGPRVSPTARVTAACTERCTLCLYIISQFEKALYVHIVFLVRSEPGSCRVAQDGLQLTV